MYLQARVSLYLSVVCLYPFTFNADDAVIPTEEPFGEIKDGRKVKR